MTKRTTYLLVGIPVAAIALLAFFLLVVSSSVRNGSISYPTDEGYYYGEDVATSAPDFGGVAEESGRGVGTPGLTYPTPYPTAGDTAAEVDQKIIKTGYLALIVGSVNESVTSITALATGKGGFVQNSSVTQRADETYYGSITVRVPSSEFETAMTDIKASANVVETESVTGQDVTEEYTDLEAQLRNARAQEVEYLEILERAEKIEDILLVQQYLSSVRSQIESLQGRINYLENITSYSTISVSLSEEPTVRVPTQEFRPLAIVNEAAQALVNLAQSVLGGFIWLVIVGGGVALPILLIAWAIVKIVKRLAK